MQGAHMQGKGAVGNWVVIGHSAPGSRVSNNTSNYESNVFTYYSMGANWTVKPKSNLNDCKASVNTDLWSLTASVSSGLSSHSRKQQLKKFEKLGQNEKRTSSVVLVLIIVSFVN